MMNNRDVVHRKVPDHIYVPLKQAEARAGAVIVVELSELLPLQQLVDLSDRRREQECVIDHQRQISPIGLVDQTARQLRTLRKRFLDQDVFSRLQRGESQ